MPDVTVAGYAALRKKAGLTGATRQSIEKAIHKGRLKECIVKTSPMIMIDPYVADREWERNTRKEVKADAGGDDDDEEPRSNVPDLNLEKARKARFDADLAELNLLRAKGDVVDLREMKALWFKAWREHRDRVLAIENEADRLVTIMDAAELRHQLGLLLRLACDDLPRDAPTA